MHDIPSTIRKVLQTHPALSYADTADLVLDDVRLSEIADRFGTPCWVTSITALKARGRALQEAFQTIGQAVSMHFAAKANDHLTTLTTLQQLGFGADIVSGGELRRAVRAGIAPSDIVFSGVGKSDDELRLALSAQIGVINVESAEEIDRLAGLAKEMACRPRVALRVNPHIDAGTHEKISTGREGDKFGIDWRIAPEIYRRAAANPHLHVIGLAAHIGSQITLIAPFSRACRRLSDMVDALRADGLTVTHVDCGGGLGICYRDETPPDILAYAQTIKDHLGQRELSLSIEPGRWLTGPTGILLTRVIETKATCGPGSDFVFIDVAMNDLARPALYDAWHDIIPVSIKHHQGADIPQTFAGPICESGDVLAQDRALPRMQRGDLLAVLDTGAYGSVMSSTYNSRPLAAQIVVEGGRMALVRPRQDIDALWAEETLPDWHNAE